MVAFFGVTSAVLAVAICVMGVQLYGRIRSQVSLSASEFVSKRLQCMYDLNMTKQGSLPGSCFPFEHSSASKFGTRRGGTKHQRSKSSNSLPRFAFTSLFVFWHCWCWQWRCWLSGAKLTSALCFVHAALLQQQQQRYEFVQTTESGAMLNGHRHQPAVHHV